MKTLKQHIAESKALQQNINIQENFKFKINRNNTIYTCQPKTRNELRQIIEDRYKEQGPGTKQEPIYFNDIDISKIDDLSHIFENTKFEYIDLSDWDVSNVYSMYSLFTKCYALREVNLSGWDVKRLESAGYMFDGCNLLKRVDLSWKNTSKIALFKRMFCDCINLQEVDISSFDLSGAKDMWRMFSNCISLSKLYLPNDFVPTKDITVTNMFVDCKNEIIPDWYDVNTGDLKI